MHGQNIDSFLRRFNDPQTAETFNESAAAPAACLRLLREMLWRRRLHFFCACRKLPRQLLPRLAISISLVPLLPLPLLLLLLLLFVAHFAVSTIWLRFRVNTFYVPQTETGCAGTDNQKTNWQLGKWFLHWLWQGIIHSLTQNE